MICLYTMKWLQVLIFNTDYSIQHYSFICIHSNDSEYCYVIPIFQFRLKVIEFQVLLFNTNNSIQNFLFVCTQLNCSKHCYASLTIQLSSHLFTHDEMIKQFYFKQFNLVCHLFAHSLNV